MNEILPLKRTRGRPKKTEQQINLKINKDYLKQYNNDYYHRKIKRITRPILCDCGKSIDLKYTKKHLLTPYHFKHIQK
jgi:hypothetical protein